jgi:hypothetical protein
MIKPKVVLLIFVSGKIVLTGAKVIIFSSFTLCCLYIVDVVVSILRDFDLMDVPWAF